MNLIGVALHCHWKQSQRGTVLKIAPCWQLTGSVYTAIVKAVQVMSVCDLKGGMSGTTSHNIYSSSDDLWSLLQLAKEAHRKAQKHMECSYKVVILLTVTRFWD